MLFARTIKVVGLALLSGVFTAGRVTAADSAAVDGIQPLQIRGENFVDSSGQPVRFWGMNVVAFYPSHDLADKVADNLADRQVNLVRPHHMLRPSSDWESDQSILSLQSSDPTTREPNVQAWDRFDYFNNALRKHGIYLMLAVWWTRNYMPGDVDVLTTDQADRQAWMDGISELNSWDWKKGFDPRKMLAVVDERSGALNEEFARQMLTHVNPYSHLAYGQDPQVLTLELINEYSTEYAIICGNRMPDYFQHKLDAKWRAFTTAAGFDAGDLYKPAGARGLELRAAFCRKLDEDYLLRMKALVQGTGGHAAVCFSNLWRGDNQQDMYARSNDYIEDHMYGDPLVVAGRNDFVLSLSNTPIINKPYIVGELNQSEGASLVARQSPIRSMLPLAASAYGSLQNWSGITFFAWMHGDKLVGEDGWERTEARKADIGNMFGDGMQLDHLRTCGMLFRRGLLDRSTSPITLHVEPSFVTGNYNSLMRGKYTIEPGWQDIHEIRKTFGPVPAGQAAAQWMLQPPANPLVSDTRQIIKDVDRKQLTVAAPQAEAFSGLLDNKAPAALEHLQLSGDGFATVVVVADDRQPLFASTHLVISRTNVDTTNKEIDGPVITLHGMKQPTADQHWYLLQTRPRDTAGAAVGEQAIQISGAGELTLGNGAWHECELELK